MAFLRLLIPLVALFLATGGAVVWQNFNRSQSCQTDNDCPKQFCQPPGKPCAQYYCIQGKCRLVEPPSVNHEVITLTPGQTVNIKNTDLSITLLRIIPAPEGSFDYPTRAELEVRSGNQKEKITFIAGVSATEEVAQKLRQKEVFGFKIIREKLTPESIILRVEKL